MAKAADGRGPLTADHRGIATGALRAALGPCGTTTAPALAGDHWLSCGDR